VLQVSAERADTAFTMATGPESADPTADPRRTTCIEVVNRYGWVMNPRQGRLRVRIDGQAAGFSPLNGSLRVEMPPGRHTVRISLWGWYWSRPVEVDVPAGSTVVLEGDIDRASSVIRRIADMLIHPLSCMVLSVRGAGAAEPDVSVESTRAAAISNARGERLPRQVSIGGAVQAAGFVLIIAGLRTAWPLIVVGAAVVIAGFAWTVRAMRARKRAMG
jgi:hypothetical protein